MLPARQRTRMRNVTERIEIPGRMIGRARRREKRFWSLAGISSRSESVIWKLSDSKESGHSKHGSRSWRHFRRPFRISGNATRSSWISSENCVLTSSSTCSSIPQESAASRSLDPHTAAESAKRSASSTACNWARIQIAS